MVSPFLPQKVMTYLVIVLQTTVTITTRTICAFPPGRLSSLVFNRKKVVRLSLGRHPPDSVTLGGPPPPSDATGNGLQLKLPNSSELTTRTNGHYGF